jgi:1,4-alpha-glucan branching enzyme
MNDTLRYMEMDPIYRKHHHDLITFSFMYAFSENFILPLSHDEVVHGKKSLLDKIPGDAWQKFAGLRLLYAYMMIHPGKKLLFMGSEFGQGLEWRFSYGLEWQLLEVEPHKKLQAYTKDLNYLYKDTKAMHEIDNHHSGFDFIDPHNADQSVIVLMRKGKKKEDFIIAVLNFTPVLHKEYRIGVPFEGTYEEVFNSDDHKYWGSGQIMEGRVLEAEKTKWHNKEFSINIKVPPLGATFIKGKDIIF